jgi:EAL domain-containing protein (putative c-di-GMP-specific phosphodiesterase class I)
MRHVRPGQSARSRSDALELTEHGAPGPELADTLARIRANGVALAIDDTGARRSSLSRLLTRIRTGSRWTAS